MSMCPKKKQSRSAVHAKLLGGDHQEQVQSWRTDVERPQAGHFREQREEQVVLPSVVGRVLVAGRTY